MRKLILVLLLITFSAYGGRIGPGEAVYITPAAAPSNCADGQMIVDSGDSNKFKKCESGTFETIGGDISSTGNADLNFIDEDTTDSDNSVTLRANCTDTGSGSEDCDFSIRQQIAGTETEVLDVDADGNFIINKDVEMGVGFNIFTAAGTVAKPNIRIGAVNSGLYADSTSSAVVRLTVAGTKTFQWESGNATSLFKMLVKDSIGSSTVPMFAGATDNNSGMSIGSDIVYLITGGGERGKFDSAGLDVTGALTVNGGPITSLVSSPATTSDLGMSAALSTNDLVVTLTRSDGTTAPSAGSPVTVSFRDPTVTNGGFDSVEFTATNAITLEAQDTLGAGTASMLYVYLISDSTDEICLSLKFFDESELQSATALTGGAETSTTTLYCTGAHTTKPIRHIGHVIATNSGPNWGTIAKVSHGIHVPYEFKGVILTADTVTATATTPVDITGASLTLTAGTWMCQYNMHIFIDEDSGSALSIQGKIGMVDAANADISGMTSHTQYTVLEANAQLTLPASARYEVIVTQTTTYNLEIECNTTVTTEGSCRAEGGQSITGGLTNPDVESTFSCERVR